MGAATAIMATSLTTDIGATVSDSGYASASTLLRLFYPGTLLASHLLRDIDLEQVKPEEAIKNIGSRHLLLIHGDLDKNVPVRDAYKLKENGGENVELWIWPGVVHSAAYAKNPAGYIARVAPFFDKYLQPN